MDHREAWLRLTLIGGLGPVLTQRCLDHFESPAAALAATSSQLRQIPGFGSHVAERFCRERDALDHSDTLSRERDAIAAHDVTLITRDDDAYPAMLKYIPDPPPLLYVCGQLQREDGLALGIVGSRRCTAYGREQADRMAAQAVTSGLCVVSGGARGVDAAAHHAAIRLSGRTIAVIGSGLARPYPDENVSLFESIADGHGAVISELPMTAPPRAENFPRRNRIISGLSLGVLVIEAAKRSGALITARLAAEEHHREVMALPGRVDSLASAGCHQIIRQGWATLVTGIGDVLEALGETGRQLMAVQAETAPPQSNDPDTATAVSTTLATTPSQQAILDALTAPMSLDDLLAETNLSVPGLRADITLLQIRGLVRQHAGRFSRSRA